MSTIRAICAAKSPAPWLMLPPLFKCGEMLYNFYSLAEDRVLTFNKRRRGAGGGFVDSDQIPPDGAKLVGSSHGWLASFDEDSNHVFLSNPISGRHIKLPPVDTLPDPHINLFDGRGSVSRVILSDEEARHAMITYGPGRRLAFCAPGAAAWAPLGDRLSWYEGEDENMKFAVLPWEDTAYCAGTGVFTSIQPLAFTWDGYYVEEAHGKNEHHCQMFQWKIPEGLFHDELPVCNLEEQEEKLRPFPLEQCIQMPHLVYADSFFSGTLPLIVLRLMDRGIGDGGNEKQLLRRREVYRARINTFPYRSVSFLVLQPVDHYPGIFWHLVKDLKGLAIFVGMNHSFAIPATGNLKANSIYFTDAGRITPVDRDEAPGMYGGHDIGVYDYEKKTISPCYYPCDYERFSRIEPPPMWFTPNNVIN